jgi:hypothetical protein
MLIDYARQKKERNAAADVIRRRSIRRLSHWSRPAAGPTSSRSMPL